MNEMLKHLNDAIAGVREVDLPDQANALPLVMRAHGLAKAIPNLETRRVKGINAAGFLAVHEISRALRQGPGSDRYFWGATHEDFANVVATTVLKHFTPGAIATDSDLQSVKYLVGEWYEKEARPRTQFIPCDITPYKGFEFAVGPVVFFDVEDLKKHWPFEADFTKASVPFLERMVERHARWVARVDVPASTDASALRRAELSVDIALTVIKLIFGSEMSAHMGRITARLRPPYATRLSLREGVPVPSHRNQHAGNTLRSEDFEFCLKRDAQFIEITGEFIRDFLNGAGKRRRLSQAWCDSAYWYQEGIAETMDTIATAKLESSIEVLLYAESKDSSIRQIIRALQILTGRTAKQTISDSSSVTIEKFADNLVTARSRILHGTLSTLIEEQAMQRTDLDALARTLLMHFALFIAAYRKDQQVDPESVKAFINWLESKASEFKANKNEPNPNA